MNFVKSRVIVGCIYRNRIILYPVIILYLLVYFNGCSDKVILPTIDHLVEFENTFPLRPSVDMDRLVKAKIRGGSYCVVPDEVLEITMPAILRVVTTDESVGSNKDAVYICRVSDRGTITLPVVGQINAAGKTLAQIESAIIDAYYPEYALTLPSVFVKVLEYKTAKVSISGAVHNPGIYSLRSDQMSLVALLMEAGGIIDEGAAVIRIIRSRNEDGPNGRNRPEKPDERNHERLSGSINAELIKSSLLYPNSNETNVQLDFKPISEHSTVGVITITNDKGVLLTGQVDITSEIERLVLLKQLSWREPGISTAEVSRKLCALSELLKPGSGDSGIEQSIVNKRVVSLAEIDESRISYKQNNLHEPKFFAAFGTQQPKALPELYKPSYDAHYETRGKNAYPNSKSNTAYPKRITNTYTAINEELDDIFDIVTKQKVGGKGEKTRLREPETIVLPVKGFNIPFADIVLKDGDNIIVERLAQPLFSVVGLVNRAGNFPYPPNVRYNLMQALAFAGGLNPAAEPRYATVYRLKPDGSVIHATFELVKTGNSSHLTEALNVQIKPGDIVSVEHTPRTRTNVFLDRVFRINMGTYFSLNEVWDD